MNYLSKYFNWLQKDVPTGEVEKYPEINENGETSVKGIFIIGDLTGIPLLKLAAESGKKIIDYFSNDSEFQKLKQANTDKNIYDVLIVGAGPAGIAAGIEASKKNFSFLILESAKKFNTIVNFPKGKPIIAAPGEYQQQSDLKINDGVKESLLDELNQQIKNIDIPVKEGLMVQKIEKDNNHFKVSTIKGDYKALRVILAIGKSGNARMLNVPGEDLPKVYNRLIDPNDAKGEDVLVVGGGDSALETAIAVSHCAKSVTLSYRKPSFARPKEQNEKKLNELVEKGKIKLLLETNVKEVKDNSAVLINKDKKDIEIPNSMVFTMIGKELPTDFFKRSNIKMEGELSVTSKLQFALLLLFASVLYFGKSSADFYDKFFGKIDSWSSVFVNLFSVEFWNKFFSLPAIILNNIFYESKVWSFTKYFNALIAYFSLIAFVLLGGYLLYRFFKEYLPQIKFNWQTFKYFYFISVGAFFAVIFFGGRYFGLELLDKSQSFWYTAFYSFTILIFGLHRMKMKPTRYIKFQTWTLILIQAFPLFILPEILLPYLGKIGALGSNDGFIMTQVFPNGSYWHAYGFILAWPLFMPNLYGNITTFWLVFSLIQTFVVIPYIVYRWGKGAYCGWICSCGALAETLGDEYRTLALHGPKAKKWENFGQWALLAAFVVTGLKLFSVLHDFNIPIINEKISYTADVLHNIYYIGIDVIFAGVLGVGVYFFLSGRVWCRFGCPLAAWMHIVNRFSRYRIFSDKKKCISCNICTKVCHMGIDVMNFANKGIPMNDVECVRCSACVVNCPTQVLSFGSLPKADLDNDLYKNIKFPVLNNTDWRSGL
ncbi:NAD(P)-binding domain-containing protein [Ignavibacterium sp.]|uniref:NAD(P)-binding domain-containing protein n=1 Tax=Ignavibacterium sp. TaxID=2651167 RepID=UPI00307DB981